MPGFYFCLCPDSALSRDRVDELLAAQPGAELRVFWADDNLDARFWEALTVPGLAASARVVIVRAAQSLPAEIWKKLSATLATPRSGILPIFFLESAWEKGQPKLPAHIAKLKCLDFAEKKGWIWRAPGLDARSLPRFAQAEAKRLGLTLSKNMLETLCGVLPPEAAAVRGALEQLFLASPGGVPDEALIGQLAEYNPEVILFDLIRDLETGRTAEVWAAVARSNADAALFPLLALLAREARILWQILAGESVYLPQHVAGMKRDVAARLGTGGLARLFRAIMETEWAVKSGRRQPAQALEALAADLGLLFAGARRSGPA